MSKKKIRISAKQEATSPRKQLKIGIPGNKPPQETEIPKPKPSPSRKKKAPIGIEIGLAVQRFLANPNAVWIFGGSIMGIILIGILLGLALSPSQPDPERPSIADGTQANKENQAEGGVQQYGFDPIEYTLSKRDAFSASQTPMEVLYGELQIPLNTLHAITDQLPKPSPLNQQFQGMRYSLITQNASGLPAAFIFETSPFEYWVCGIGDSVFVQHGKRSVADQSHSFAGIINQSLRKTLSSKLLLADEIEQQVESGLAWTVDLYHLDPGAKLKIAYNGTYVDEKLHAIEKVEAIWMEEGNSIHQAFFFEEGPYSGYFNRQGRPMKSSFLKSPVKYAQVSSRFGMRFHPIAQREKFHYGTDYAAKEGAPIYAVADGKIINARYREHNGYYVQIQHFDGYETFYLHMQKNSFPKDILPGKIVQQGDMIGLVGATGDATGPHVCFHIRKDGVPIDPLAVKLPEGIPISPNFMGAFQHKADSLEKALNQIQYFE